MRWTPRLIAWAALLMVWEPAATLGERFTQTFAALAALFPGTRRVGRTYQGFIKAWIAWSPRLRLGLEQHWRTRVRQAAGTRWTQLGWVLFGVDGSRVAVPHTADNLRAFGCGGKNHSGPSAWRVMRLHLGTSLPWAWKIAKATADERGLLRQMRKLLPPCALVIADVDGVKVGGILFEATAVNSRTLLQVGTAGNSASHAANPIFLYDIFCLAEEGQECQRKSARGV